jgi:hypothetical protein
MNWQLITKILITLAKYAPQAATAIATAEGYIVHEDWDGLFTYLSSLLTQPTASPALKAELTPHLEQLQAL